MFKGLRARAAMKRARREYDMARLARMIDENNERIAQAERERNRPCPICHPRVAS